MAKLEIDDYLPVDVEPITNLITEITSKYKLVANLCLHYLWLSSILTIGVMSYMEIGDSFRSKDGGDFTTTAVIRPRRSLDHGGV